VFAEHSQAWFRGSTVADVDRDGDLDVIGGAHLNAIDWFAQRLVGDVNDDGRFDSRDFVLIFTAGEYEDGSNRNSTFEEGDWNGDGDFTTLDLVYAFQTGNYQREAIRNPSSITRTWKPPT
jgi:hypothetical protein